jgi:hypothetical protein
MHIGGKDIENFLLNMVLKKNILKRQRFKKHLSMPFYLGNIWAKHILIWNCPNDDLQLMKFKVVLLK